MGLKQSHYKIIKNNENSETELKKDIRKFLRKVYSIKLDDTSMNDNIIKADLLIERLQLYRIDMPKPQYFTEEISSPPLYSEEKQEPWQYTISKIEYHRFMKASVKYFNYFLRD